MAVKREVIEMRTSPMATDQPFSEALTPPGWVFHDEALFQRELREIFSKQWLCVGHRSRLQARGDYLVRSYGSESVLVVRSEDDGLKAFHNVCRHRGTRLVNTSEGQSRRFTCAYHGWSYKNDGCLAAAPGMDERPDFKLEDYPLAKLQITEWNGFLFINADQNAPPPESFWPEFPDLSRLNLGSLERVARHDYTAETNWKLVAENYNECYHCAIAHPQLHRVSAERGITGYDDHSGKNFTGGPMALREGLNTMTHSGVTTRNPLPGTLDKERDLIFYFCLYPNFFLSIAPDYVLTHYLWPKSPSSLYLESEWYCHPDQISAEGFDASDAVEFWDTTNQQDWKLCETAFKGLGSSAHKPGPYHPWESSVHDFDRWYVRTMFGDAG